MPLGKDRAITTKGARAIFASSFIVRRRKLIYPKFCEVVDSHVENDFARSIGTVPQLEEVIDEVNDPSLPDFRDYSWDWTNRLYKARVAISRDLMDFDQTRQSFKLLHSLGSRLANLPDRIFATRLIADSFYSGEVSSGTNIKLFSASHLAPIGSSTAQSNIVTGTTPSDFCATATVQAVAQQILVDFRAAKARLRGFLDDNNQPWHDDDIRAEDMLILCSPLLEGPMKQAFFTRNINATDNVYQGQVAEVITSNYLPSASTSADAADWYLIHKNELKRPFVYSRFRKIRDEEIEDAFGAELESLEQGGMKISMDEFKDLASVQIETNLSHQGMNADADVIENDRFLMGARWRGEMFGGEWRNAVKVDNAAS